VNVVAPAVPRFSDARLTIRWLTIGVVPLVVALVVVALLLPRPEPALLVGVAGAGLLLGVALASICFSRLAESRTS
jgi:hypothetical protein